MATSSKLPLLFLLAAAAAATTVCAAGRLPAPSPEDAPYKPIPNLDAAHIQQLGEWAVEEHVKQAHDGLRFNKVVDGEFQVVAGLNYVFFIDAVNGTDGTVATYTALVYVQYWTNTCELVSFVRSS